MHLLLQPQVTASHHNRQTDAMAEPTAKCAATAVAASSAAAAAACGCLLAGATSAQGLQDAATTCNRHQHSSTAIIRRLQLPTLLAQ
jgi:hypothetical protein